MGLLCPGKMTRITLGLLLLLSVSVSMWRQVTAGSILGVVLDPSEAVIAEAAVTVRNLETNDTRNARSDEEGRFVLPQLPVGSYEMTIQASGFAPYVQGPILLRLNQEANLRVRLELPGSVERVIVRDDAPLINTTGAEVGVNFDTKRISELPISTNRNVLNLALSVAGVSQLQTGQANIVLGGGSVPLTVNGMRVRSSG
jgi:carboxypeptidase family protein